MYLKFRKNFYSLEKLIIDLGLEKNLHYVSLVLGMENIYQTPLT